MYHRIGKEMTNVTKRKTQPIYLEFYPEQHPLQMEDNISPSEAVLLVVASG